MIISCLNISRLGFDLGSRPRGPRLNAVTRFTVLGSRRLIRVSLSLRLVCMRVRPPPLPCASPSTHLGTIQHGANLGYQEPWQLQAVPLRQISIWERANRLMSALL